MTNLEEMKKAIADAIHDKEVASSACCQVEAYARRWLIVFMIHNWDVWNESKKALRLQVVRWLEGQCAPYDFYQFLSGWGLVGFNSQEAANRFKLRWSGQTSGMLLPDQDWDPHPLKSTFEPIYTREALGQQHQTRPVML
jgi:hypothetical protein